jgi:Skp family chaperone for outer membrane proteins
VHQAKKIRTPFKACVTACIACALFQGAIPASGEQNSPGPVVGAVNVERLLAQYWRVSDMRAAVEGQEVSEEYRQKQMELARIEQEAADHGSWFFSRKKDEDRLRRQRAELDALAAREAKSVHEREKKAISDLMGEVRTATETAAVRLQMDFVFDASSPHILFLNINPADGDITQDVLEALNR